MSLRELLRAWGEARWQDVPVLLGISAIFAVFVTGIVGGVIMLISKLPWQRGASAIETHSSLTIAALTFALVVITAFYAAVTYRMLVQVQETRTADIKPLLWVNVGKPEFSEGPASELQRFRVQKVVFANYGKGAAVNIRIRYMVPFNWDEDLKRIERVQARAQSVPMLIDHGVLFEDELDFYTKKYDLATHRKEFLDILTIYEDTERNLYKMSQKYNLIVVTLTDETYYNLALASEELVFVAFRNRKHVGDLGETFFSDQSKYQTVFRRRSRFS